MKEVISTTLFVTVTLLIAAFTTGCSDSGSTQPDSGTSSTKRYVGEYYGGGVVFYTWKDPRGEEHGLIVSIKNQSDSSVWSNVDAPLWPVVLSRYDGKSNTTAIIKQPGHDSSAALLCDRYSAGGYDDWYLPTLQELSMLFHSIPAVNSSLASIPGAVPFTRFLFWSSYEISASDGPSLVFYFGDGVAGVPLYKSDKYPVRAIRSF